MRSDIELRSFCEAVLLNLKAILGKRAYAAVMTHVVDEYLGAKDEDIYTAIMKRPDIFESAMIDLLGHAGKILLRQSLAVTTLGGFCYSRSGDLARCMAIIKSKK
ncbi:MAG: hypothetical protein ABI348_09455 [Nitrososphaera sp.]